MVFSRQDLLREVASLVGRAQMGMMSLDSDRLCMMARRVPANHQKRINGGCRLSAIPFSRPRPGHQRGSNRCLQSVTHFPPQE